MEKTREIEAVEYPQMNDLNLFVDTVDYRTPHLHREWELLYILEHSLVITLPNARFTARPGDVVLLNAGQPHEFFREEESCTFLCIQISTEFLARSFPEARHLSFEKAQARPFFTSAAYQELQNDVLNLAVYYLKKPQNYQLYCAGTLHLLLYKLLQQLPHCMLTSEQNSDLEKRGQRMQRLLKFVDERYHTKICLSDFAAQEDRSLSYMSHFVKENLGQSFQNYVDTVRFHSACKMIDAGQTRLLDVCMAVGFSDYRYFCRAFHQRLNLTPMEYRNRTVDTVLPSVHVHHSVHSLERFYTPQRSLLLLEAFRQGKPLFSSKEEVCPAVLDEKTNLD